MSRFLRLLWVVFQVLVITVFSDFQNDRRLLEDYNSRLLVYVNFLINGMCLKFFLDMNPRCCQALNWNRVISQFLK